MLPCRAPEQSLISIVDDDESLRQAIRGLIKSVGLAAEVFACAEDFLSSERRSRTACVISDVQMPGLSGVELHSRLVNSGERIPVILVTAYPDDAERIRALQAGVIGYLIKPFNDDELLAHVYAALGCTP